MKKTWLLLLLPVCLWAQNDSLVNSKFKDAVHLREVPRHNWVIDLGLTEATGDYADIARTGLNLGAEYVYYVNKNLGIGAAARHQYNEFAYLDFQNSDTVNSTDNNYSMTSVSIGPSLSLTKKRFQIDFFARSGVAFLNNPDNLVTQLGVGNTQVFASDQTSSSDAAAFLEGGIRLNYYFRRSVQVFFAPQYSTTLGKPITYTIRDNDSTAPIVPNTSIRINASNLLLNLGIKIAIGKEYSNGECRIDD
ncbi:autotransporter outer membrane beta-barrel domain-containing protein [Nonlabens xiamenensis]|uniref:autotransporter outer membrane beta-barrel domain-containing protein n=1 Tax=Nonlabens xiamenensis TaxID=2341043 RepID=UPI000F605807|nr:autotransporter outer membrane beta-barrel domain-containing protein [Nonlabens xiamenensis]